MDFGAFDFRARRNFLNRGMSFTHMHYNVANYNTDSPIDKKTDMKAFDEDIFTKIQSIPDPLKKNLADTVVTNTEKQKEVSQPQYYYEPTMTGEKVANENSAHRSDFYPSIAGITTFFSNFFGAISGAMFHRRPKSPVTQYFDCYESDSHMSQQMSLDDWQTANIDDQNKTEAPVQFSMVSHGNMNNCKAAVAQCESKINAVRSLLKNKPTNPPKSKLRRPRRAFVDPASVEDSYEEDFVPDDFISLPNEHYVNHIVIGNNQDHIFTEIDSPKMKTEIGSVPATNDIVKVISDNKSEFADTSVILNDPKAKQENLNSTTTNSIEKSTGQQNCATTQNPIPTDKQNLNLTEIKKEVISSCEDKMARLKSLLQEKCKKQKVAPADPIPVPTNDRPKPKPIPIDKKHDKRFKNPCRLVDKRKKAKLKNNIQDDMNFANELDSEEIESSLDNSPAILSNHMLQRISETLPESFESDKEYFDELKGRFHSASTTDSEDSFQIVFSDSPKLSRMRRPSDCDSEDSFVVFEDSPDSCYTSNDVFGDHQTTDESDSECSDDDSDISDSGCGTDVCKISHSFSRTVSDLTDDTLYEEVKATELSENNDEVDCAVVEKPVDDAFVKPGLLIDEVKKRQRKDQPSKKVSFSEAPPKVHVMRVWAFAARQARAGHWERHALDRERFRRRIADVDMAVSWVLKPQHRRRVMFQRFMPWWNAQKRKEAAEKKQKAEEEKLRLEKETEEEKLRLEKEAEDKAKEEVLAVDTNHILEEKVPEPILEVEREKKEIENDIIKEDVIEKLENLKLFIVKEKVLTN